MSRKTSSHHYRYRQDDLIEIICNDKIGLWHSRSALQFKFDHLDDLLTDYPDAKKISVDINSTALDIALYFTDTLVAPFSGKEWSILFRAVDFLLINERFQKFLISAGKYHLKQRKIPVLCEISYSEMANKFDNPLYLTAKEKAIIDKERREENERREREEAQNLEEERREDQRLDEREGEEEVDIQRPLPFQNLIDAMATFAMPPV